MSSAHENRILYCNVHWSTDHTVTDHKTDTTDGDASSQARKCQVESDSRDETH